MNAYDTALESLMAGAMPFIVEVDDGIHVMSVVPTSRSTLACMINPDERTRMKFMVNVAVALKRAAEEACV
jgi:hypothetical protein